MRRMVYTEGMRVGLSPSHNYKTNTGYFKVGSHWSVIIPDSPDYDQWWSLIDFDVYVPIVIIHHWCVTAVSQKHHWCMVHIAYTILIIIIPQLTYIAYNNHRSNSIDVHIAKLSLKHPSNITRYRKSLTLPNFPDETLKFRTATAINEEQCSYCLNMSVTMQRRRSMIQCELSFRSHLLSLL